MYVIFFYAKNIIMMWLIVLLTVVIIFVLALFLPIKIKFALHINMEKDIIYYSVKMLFIKIICGQIKFEDNCIKMQNQNNIFKNEFISDLFKNWRLYNKVKWQKIYHNKQHNCLFKHNFNL